MSIGAIVTVLAVLGTVATTLDAPIPKPAWKTDLERVERYVQTVDKRTLETRLRNVRRDIYRNLSEQDAWKAKGKSVPPYLIKERADLIDDKERIERKLRRLE